jgi:hypothetical protein
MNKAAVMLAELSNRVARIHDAVDELDDDATRDAARSEILAFETLARSTRQSRGVCDSLDGNHLAFVLLDDVVWFAGLTAEQARNYTRDSATKRSYLRDTETLPEGMAEQLAELAGIVGHLPEAQAAALAPRQDRPTVVELRQAAAKAGGHSDERRFDRTFRRIREAAGMTDNPRGGAGKTRRYTPEEVDSLMRAVREGGRVGGDKIAASWAKWGTAAT